MESNFGNAVGYNSEIDCNKEKIKIKRCLEECGKQQRSELGNLEQQKQKEEKEGKRKRKRKTRRSKKRNIMDAKKIAKEQEI